MANIPAAHMRQFTPENLDDIETVVVETDLLIIGGTSLMVYPAAALIDYFRGRHVVVINLSDTGRETGADLTIRRSIDEVLSEAVD